MWLGKGGDIIGQSVTIQNPPVPDFPGATNDSAAPAWLRVGTAYTAFGI